MPQYWCMKIVKTKLVKIKLEIPNEQIRIRKSTKKYLLEIQKTNNFKYIDDAVRFAVQMPQDGEVWKK